MSDFNKSQITQKGHALLAKVLANTTDLTFTKVVAGDGTYTDDIWDLTEMISPKLQGSIIDVSVFGAVSKVVCSINNSTLENYLEFREIGVYANDPDEGEILFSYANAGDRYDYIAAYNGEELVEEEITFNMYTANATNINAVVEHTGYASQIDFNNTGSRLNSTRVESAIKEVSNKTDQLSNPNLLINSNFRISELVNQRGENTYSSDGTAIKPKFDMWNMSSGNASMNFTANLEDEFAKLSITNNAVTNPYGTLIQRIESVNNFMGKTVTLSARVKFDIDGYPFRFGFGSGYGGNVAFNSSSEWQTIKYTTTIPNSIGSLYAVIQLIGNNAYSVEIDYIKLELGEIATPFVDDDYTTKITKCQRYLQKVSGTQNVGNGIVRTTSTTDTALIILKLDTPMRIDAPNLITNNVNMGLTTYPTSLKSLTGAKYLFPKATESNLAFLLSTNNTTGLSLNSPVVVQFSNTDYILLSAEL